MMTEIKKLFKSRIILYILIIMAVISLSFSLFVLNRINDALTLNEKQTISSEFNFELIYYCMPLFVVFLADFIFNKDITSGTMKHLIIKSDRTKIYIYKIIGLFLTAVILNIVFNLINSLFIKFMLDIDTAGKFLMASLYECIPVIEMSLIFSLLSIISKKNNIVYLISLHFIFLILTESPLFIGKYTYLGDFKAAISEDNLSIPGIIKSIVLIIATYLIFKNKELTE